MNRIIFLSTIFIGLTGCGGSGSEADKIVPVPIASTLNLATSEDVSVTGTLAGQSTSGGTLSYKLVSDPSNGDATLNGSQVEYIPNEHYFGEDSFTFTVSENGKTSTPAKINVTVNSVNDAPETSQKEFEIEEDEALVESFGIYDPDNDSWQITLVEPPELGNITINSDGTFEYIPNENIFGIENLSYSVSDGELESQISSITIDIQSINDAPVVPEETVIEVKSGDYTTIELEGTDIETEGLSFNIESPPTKTEYFEHSNNSSALSLKYKYGYLGEDQFSYLAKDGELFSNAGRVKVNVSVAGTTHQTVRQSFPGVIDSNGNTYMVKNDNKFIYSSSSVNEFRPSNLIPSKVSGQCISTCSFIMSMDEKGQPESLHFVSMPSGYSEPVAVATVEGDSWMVTADYGNNLFLNIVKESSDTSAISTSVLSYPNIDSDSYQRPSVAIFDDGGIVVLNNSEQENVFLYSKDKLKLAQHIGVPDVDFIDYWEIHDKYEFPDFYRVIGYAFSNGTSIDRGLFVVDVQKDGSFVNYQFIGKQYGDTNGYQDSAFLSTGEVVLVFSRTLAVWDKDLNEVWSHQAASFNGSHVKVSAQDQVYWLHIGNNNYSLTTYDANGQLINFTTSNAVADSSNKWLLIVDSHGNAYVAYSNQSYPEPRIMNVDYVDFSGKKQWTNTIESETGFFRNYDKKYQMAILESTDDATAYLFLALNKSPEPSGGLTVEFKGVVLTTTIDRGIKSHK